MTQTLYDVLMVLFLIIAVLLILVILVQRGRGGGLVGAFGGPGGSSAFGAKTGDVFTVITVVMAALFLIIACLLAFRPAPQLFVDPLTTPPIQSPVEPSDESARVEPHALYARQVLITAVEYDIRIRFLTAVPDLHPDVGTRS